MSCGYKIPFKFVPKQCFLPKNPKVSGSAHEVLVQEAADLLAKESIVPVGHVKGQFVSSYFAVSKARSPGKFRPILNLKCSTSFRQVRDWIQNDAWFCSMDLKDAFLHIPINESLREFLRPSGLGLFLNGKCFL